VTEVLDILSEEEAYLYAILADPSGLDQAEFLWVDPSSEDNKFCPHCGTEFNGAHLHEHDELGPDDWEHKYPAASQCFRAWAFQWPWWRTSISHQVDQCARSVGKSLSVKVRACAFPFLFPGQEMVITAPELVHLEPIVGLIETQFYATRLLREMIPSGRSAFTHRPFQANFLNGARLIGRIPQRDGRGVKGVHPIWLELDEAADYPSGGWTELRETLKRGFEGAMLRAHGVTRGCATTSMRSPRTRRTTSGRSTGWRQCGGPTGPTPNAKRPSRSTDPAKIPTTAATSWVAWRQDEPDLRPHAVDEERRQRPALRLQLGGVLQEDNQGREARALP
jgi:hypothetical protein